MEYVLIGVGFTALVLIYKKYTSAQPEEDITDFISTIRPLNPVEIRNAYAQTTPYDPMKIVNQRDIKSREYYFLDKNK